MTKKRMLADVLWQAANEHLDDDFDTASCCVAYRAEFGDSWGFYHNTWKRAARESKAVQFLKELGCRVGSTSAFERFQRGEQRQGVRYMWLLLAACVAEDEGIEL